MISINFQRRFRRENKLHSLKENNHTVIIITTMASSRAYTLFAHEDPDTIRCTVKRIADKARKLVVMQGCDACDPRGFRTKTANLIKTYLDIKMGGSYASIITVLDDNTFRDYAEGYRDSHASVITAQDAQTHRDFSAKKCIIINACNKSIQDVGLNMVPFHTYLTGLKSEDVIIVRCVGDRSQMDTITFGDIMSATPTRATTSANIPIPRAPTRNITDRSLISSF